MKTTIMLMLMVVTTVMACGRNSITTTDCNQQPRNNPPHFTYCPSTDVVVTASLGSSKAAAIWSTPPAEDPGDAAPKILQESGPPSGSVLNEGYTPISYKAWDSQGLSDFCYFSVQVKVVYCPDPTPLFHGKQTCSGDKKNIDGSVCSHSCDHGYELLGSYNVQCARTADGITGSWNTAFPTCQPVSCGVPSSVAGGSFQCPSGHTYTATCFLTCNSGYKYSGPYFISCTAAKSWTAAYSCKDVEPPKFSSGCPARQDLYSGPLESPVPFTWIDPIITDNSGGVVTMASNPQNGSFVGTGVTVVTLTATDTAGNSASCFFVVIVKARECPPLSPSYHGKVTCSYRFVEGSQCTVTCEEGNRPSGNNTLTCLASGTWDAPLPTCAVSLVPLNTPREPQGNDVDTPLPHTSVLIIAVTVCGTVLLLAVVATVGIYKYKHHNYLQYGPQSATSTPEVVDSLLAPDHPPSYSDAMKLKAVKMTAL